MGKEKTYEVEFESITWRTISVEAKSEKEAEEKAWESVGVDWDISKAWRENAEISNIELDNEQIFCNDGSITIQKHD